MRLRNVFKTVGRTAQRILICSKLGGCEAAASLFSEQTTTVVLESPASDIIILCSGLTRRVGSGCAGCNLLIE